MPVKFGCDIGRRKTWCYRLKDNPTDFRIFRKFMEFLPHRSSEHPTRKKIDWTFQHSVCSWQRTCHLSEAVLWHSHSLTTHAILHHQGVTSHDLTNKKRTNTQMGRSQHVIHFEFAAWSIVLERFIKLLHWLLIRLHSVFSDVPFEWPTKTNHRPSWQWHKSDQGSTPHGISPLATTFDHLTHLRVQRNDYPCSTVIHHDSSPSMHGELLDVLEAAHCLSHQI